MKTIKSLGMHEMNEERYNGDGLGYGSRAAARLAFERESQISEMAGHIEREENRQGRGDSWLEHQYPGAPETHSLLSRE